jgi:hypothetical protein
MRSVRAAAVVLALVVPALPGTARAAVEPDGVNCGFSSLADPTGPPDEQLGMLNGGPVTLTDPDAPGRVVSGSLVCSLRQGLYHTDPLLAQAASPVTPGVVVVPPTLVTYTADPVAWITACTEVRVDGGPTLYWDDEAEVWSTDPGVLCYDFGPEPDPLGEVVDGLFVDVVDPLLCAVLVTQYPPEGDLPGIWDCPPYGHG